LSIFETVCIGQQGTDAVLFIQIIKCQPSVNLKPLSCVNLSTTTTTTTTTTHHIERGFHSPVGNHGDGQGAVDLPDGAPIRAAAQVLVLLDGSPVKSHHGGPRGLLSLFISSGDCVVVVSVSGGGGSVSYTIKSSPDKKARARLLKHFKHMELFSRYMEKLTSLKDFQPHLQQQVSTSPPSLPLFL
jgi:hypothetical protein